MKNKQEKQRIDAESTTGGIVRNRAHRPIPDTLASFGPVLQQSSIKGLPADSQ